MENIAWPSGEQTTAREWAVDHRLGTPIIDCLWIERFLASLQQSLLTENTLLGRKISSLDEP